MSIAAVKQEPEAPYSVARGKQNGPGAGAAGRADEAKKARIVEAAITEFANHGYKNANTNRIVEAAGVSKGLLFHYFGSKKDLYVYLYNYALGVIIDEFFAGFDWNEKDIFKCWRAGAEMKFEMMRKYGLLFEFILDAYIRTDGEVRQEIDTSTMAWIEMSWSNMLKGADRSLFREGIDAEKALQIIYWTIEGHSKKWLTANERLPYYKKMYGALMDELDEYLSILRGLFYKNP